MSQHAAAPSTSPAPTPASTRWPSITHDSAPATAGITQKSIDTAAAPCTLMARTYSDTARVALSSTTAAIAAAAWAPLRISKGIVAASAAAGTNATAFCTALAARKSTPPQNRC